MEDGSWWELLEYIERGSLRELLAEAVVVALVILPDEVEKLAEALTG